MVILRFKVHSKTDKRDATEGVVEFDIARVLGDPECFIATAVYEDGAALERQEALPEVHRVMAMLPESLLSPPERTIFDAALDPTLV
jgi:quinol monooxygenase YgiN